MVGEIPMIASIKMAVRTTAVRRYAHGTRLRVLRLVYTKPSRYKSLRLILLRWP